MEKVSGVFYETIRDAMDAGKLKVGTEILTNGCDDTTDTTVRGVVGVTSEEGFYLFHNKEDDVGDYPECGTRLKEYKYSFHR